MSERKQYDNTNTAILFRNTKKERDSQPDFRGMGNFEGVDIWLSGWITVGREGTKRAGEKYFNIKFERRDEQPTAAAPRPQRQAAVPRPSPRPSQTQPGMDDDIPF